MFLDESGRRRRWVFACGLVAGGASAFWLAALIAGALGFSTLPSLRAHLPLLSQRAEAHEVASLRRRHDVPVPVRRPSPLGHTIGLAVSRGLIAGE